MLNLTDDQAEALREAFVWETIRKDKLREKNKLGITTYNDAVAIRDAALVRAGLPEDFLQSLGGQVPDGDN